MLAHVEKWFAFRIKAQNRLGVDGAKRSLKFSLCLGDMDCLFWQFQKLGKQGAFVLVRGNESVHDGDYTPAFLIPSTCGLACG